MIVTTHEQHIPTSLTLHVTCDITPGVTVEGHKTVHNLQSAKLLVTSTFTVKQKVPQTYTPWQPEGLPERKSAIGEQDQGRRQWTSVAACSLYSQVPNMEKKDRQTDYT